MALGGCWPPRQQGGFPSIVLEETNRLGLEELPLPLPPSSRFHDAFRRRLWQSDVCLLEAGQATLQVPESIESLSSALAQQGPSRKEVLRQGEEVRVFYAWEESHTWAWLRSVDGGTRVHLRWLRPKPQEGQRERSGRGSKVDTSPPST